MLSFETFSFLKRFADIWAKYIFNFYEILCSGANKKLFWFHFVNRFGKLLPEIKKIFFEKHFIDLNCDKKVANLYPNVVWKKMRKLDSSHGFIYEQTLKYSGTSLNRQGPQSVHFKQISWLTKISLKILKLKARTILFPRCEHSKRTQITTKFTWNLKLIILLKTNIFGSLLFIFFLVFFLVKMISII